MTVENVPFASQRTPQTRIEQIEGESIEFPLIFTPVPNKPECIKDFESLQKWIESNQTLVADLIRKHGAVIFRGFPVDSPQKFNDLVESTGVEPLPYVGGAAPRTNVYKGVFTSNESPPSEKIPFHHEMAQVPVYPSQIFFFSEIAAAKGGATPILRSDVLYDKVNERYPEFAKKLLEKGVRYTRVLPSVDDPQSPIGRSWPSTFQTSDFEIAKSKARELGVELSLMPDGSGNVKSVSGVLPAIKQYAGKIPMDGGKRRFVFFNSMIAAYTGWKDSRNDPKTAVTYGDGQPLETEWIEGVVKIMDEIAVVLPWERCDVMCVDNNLVMHARQSYEPPRRVLAYVAK